MSRLIIRKVAVLGAGVMGAQIAAHCANASVPVILFDLPKEGDPNAIAKKVFDALWNGEGGGDANAADAIIEAQGLKQVTDSGAIEAIIDEVLAANQKSVDEFRAGKEKAFNALVGQCMKASKGKANPAQVNELLKKKLG